MKLNFFSCSFDRECKKKIKKFQNKCLNFKFIPSEFRISCVWNVAVSTIHFNLAYFDLNIRIGLSVRVFGLQVNASHNINSQQALFFHHRLYVFEQQVFAWFFGIFGYIIYFKYALNRRFKSVKLTNLNNRSKKNYLKLSDYFVLLFIRSFASN